MKTHADKSQENIKQSVAHDVSKTQHTGAATFQLVDNRPGAVAQRKLQEMANHSPIFHKFKTLQALKNNYSQLKKVNNYNILTNNKSEQIVQRLAIGKYDDYKGYLNGDGMIRNPANVGYFVGLLRAGKPLPMSSDPMTAAMNVKMIATPDDGANYINAEEYEGKGQPKTVTKHVLVTGHHRFAAYVEEGLDLPPIGDGGYAMSGYNWRNVPGADYDLKDTDIPKPSI